MRKMQESGRCAWCHRNLCAWVCGVCSIKSAHPRAGLEVHASSAFSGVMCTQCSQDDESVLMRFIIGKSKVLQGNVVRPVSKSGIVTVGAFCTLQ